MERKKFKLSRQNSLPPPPSIFFFARVCFSLSPHPNLYLSVDASKRFPFTSCCTQPLPTVSKAKKKCLGFTFTSILMFRTCVAVCSVICFSSFIGISASRADHIGCAEITHSIYLEGGRSSSPEEMTCVLFFIMQGTDGHFSIDSEEYEAMTVEVTLLPRKLRFLCHPSQKEQLTQTAAPA